MSNKIVIVLLISMFCVAFSTGVLAQSIQNNTSTPTLAPLQIPPVTSVESGPEPTMPPFDPAQVPPCNMTQVRAEMAADPRSDPYHTGPITP